LDPLESQALAQLVSAPNTTRAISDLAERLVKTLDAAVQLRFQKPQNETSPEQRQEALPVWAKNFGVR
jgi:hypothetical protein